jgi:hypothetical protein
VHGVTSAYDLQKQKHEAVVREAGNLQVALDRTTSEVRKSKLAAECESMELQRMLQKTLSSKKAVDHNAEKLKVGRRRQGNAATGLNACRGRP